MKKTIYLFLLGVALLAGNHAQAQYQVGQHFISGNVDLGANRYGENSTIHNNYNHSLGLAIGKFTRENRAVGWSLQNSVRMNKFENYVPAIRKVGSMGFGLDRFVEFYLPVGEKFTLFARPSLGVSYQLQNFFTVANSPKIGGNWVLANQSQRHSYFLSVNLSGGVLWQFAEKWALQGSVAGITPLSMMFSRRVEEEYGLAPNTQKNTYTQNQLSYTLQPDLNTGYVGLGFRYFY
ncbi:hypothetical protein [Telluribacter sp.]|jgi:hypothetical protein|uniref:hypothetical protein n=1 Tax=Telluribacter sp. TaxID=1978767 RepID=UPI002E0FFE3C|nr:hypothetical protein [Telluribacter sp.]